MSPVGNHRKDAKISKSVSNSDKVLNGLVAYNKYGGYFTPLSSQQRPAVQQILNGNVYEPHTIKFMIDNCGDGDIIHAGTFFGDFLPAISNAVVSDAKVWAFEPNFENFRCAQITTLINQLDNVELFNCGLGDVKTTSKMIVQSRTGVNLGGMSRILKTQEKTGKTIEVEVNRIDDIIPQNRSISIIQLDVEGYEKQVLNGALETIARCKPLLLLEDNENIIGSEWFNQHIRSMGYEIHKKIHANTLLVIKSKHNIV